MVEYKFMMRRADPSSLSSSRTGGKRSSVVEMLMFVFIMSVMDSYHSDILTCVRAY